jgi:hypothetical protein
MRRSETRTTEGSRLAHGSCFAEPCFLDYAIKKLNALLFHRTLIAVAKQMTCKSKADD